MTPAVATDVIRVFLLDDTRELRHRVRSALSEFDDLTVVGEADDPVDGLPLIADLQPDVVVCDLSMPRMDGLEAIPRIAERAADAGIVIFSGFLSDALGETALALGADRYVEKSAPLAELADAVRAVARDRRAGVRPTPRPLPTSATAHSEPAAETPRRERPLEDAVAEARELPLRAVYAGGVAALALGGVASYLADITPTTFLVLFLAPVAAVGAIAPRWVSAAFAVAAALVYGACAQHAGVTTWPGAMIGVLITGLVLAVGAHRLLSWMHARVDHQATLAGDLRRSNAELEHFAYVASHDLAAPLRSVASFSGMLAKRYEGKLDAEADKIIGFITGGTRRMQLMIDDLLAFARASRVDAETEPVALSVLMEQVRTDLTGEIADRGAELIVGPLPEVVADGPRMTQVLLNLVSNGIKFCPADRRPRVEVTAQRLSAGWRIDVRDNGIGVDPRYASKVFGMFQRLHGEDEFPGTGIGLAICQRIVERHGGRIWVDGFEGRGSTFSFTIPDVTE